MDKAVLLLCIKHVMELSAYLLDHGIVENVNLTNAPLD